MVVFILDTSVSEGEVVLMLVLIYIHGTFLCPLTLVPEVGWWWWANVMQSIREHWRQNSTELRIFFVLKHAPHRFDFREIMEVMYSQYWPERRRPKRRCKCSRISFVLVPLLLRATLLTASFSQILLRHSESRKGLVNVHPQFPKPIRIFPPVFYIIFTFFHFPRILSRTNIVYDN